MVNQDKKQKQKVLITGGSGLVGRYLTSTLLAEGYQVAHLSRGQDQFGKVRVHRWDPEKGIVSPSVLEGVDIIIHLAGANIGAERWTKKRRLEIVSSRVDAVKLLHKVITENNLSLNTFISASAIGYYGSVTSDIIFNEKDPPAKDFTGSTCRQWEEGADLFQNSGIRTVKIRTAVVLEKSDSALSKLMLPAKFGFLAQTGNGKQYMPWIHISDLCGIYLKAIEDLTLSGAYNAVAPQQVTHKEFVKSLAQVMGKPVFPVPVPAFILRAALGEMSDIVLKGSRVSSEKISKSGYVFLYPELVGALREVLDIHTGDTLQ
jgi:hypothetical protein